ncbi:hypothetical protein [Geodermatophilus sp. SYSU D01105]
MDMAHGIELVHVVEDEILNVAPAAAEQDELADLFAAISKADAAYDDYTGGPVGGCLGVGLAPEFAEPADVSRCAEAVRESVRWQPIIAEQLRELAG